MCGCLIFWGIFLITFFHEEVLYGNLEIIADCAGFFRCCIL